MSLTLSNQAKYLGVFLDKKLHCTDNILDRTRKAAIALFACNKAIVRKWGFSPVIVHRRLNSQTGGGVFSPELDIKVSFPLPDYCCVLQAEVMAIQEAMSHLDTSEHHDIYILIFSDSQAALRAADIHMGL